MYKAMYYNGEIKYFPNATRRGETMIYTGEINRNGRKEFEFAKTEHCQWFETKEDAVLWLITFYNKRIMANEAQIERLKSLIEKVKQL